MGEIVKSADNIKQRRSGHHSKKKRKAVGNEAVLINVVSTEDTQQQMLNTKETAEFIQKPAAHLIEIQDQSAAADTIPLTVL